MSQRLFAFSFGWSAQQLKRIEAGEVAPRFGPIWDLCFMAQLNPLWLAFGEPYLRYRFSPFPVFEKHPELTPEMPFIDVMRVIGAEYKTENDKLEWGARSTSAKRPDVFIFRESLAELTAKFAEKIPRAEEQRFMAYLAACADRFVARKAISTKTIDTALNIQNKWTLTVNSRKGHWQELRKNVASATAKRGTRAALARDLGVTPQALNEWLQGRNAPPAEKTLRLLRWVESIEAKQKRAPEVRETRPARIAQKRKARSNAKPKSSRKKH
jgi:transcriptional regulator with XRE-family HTH domain